MADEIKIDAELDRIVYQDEATGLHNRRYLYTALRERVDWTATRAPVSLVLLGIDRPPNIKDFAFSGIVREIGKRLRAAADPEAILVRHSTDAYALLLLQRSREVGLKLAEGLAQEAAAEPIQGATATFSIGAAGRPEDASTPTALLDAAARALRAARRAGGNCASFPPPPGDDADLLARLPARTTVGREENLARVRAILADLKKPTFVLLHGPPGYGKTRFLDETMQAAWDARMAAARADCEPSSRHSPYRSLGILIERLGRELPDLELRVEDRLSPEHLLALRVISPNFFTGGGMDAAAELPTPQAATAAILDLMRMVSRLRPGVVLGISNGPLVDPGSLAIYRALLGAPLPLLIVMAAVDARGAAEEGESPLPAFLDELRRQRRVEEIEMRALTAEQVRHMLDAIVPGRPANPALDTAVATHGRGSPLYVEEIVRAAAIAGRSFDEVQPGVLPAAPNKAVLASVAALPVSTREALNCASVMGTTFDVDILQEMLAWRDLELQDAVDRALHARVLRASDPRVPEVLEFACGLARAACYQSIDPLTRRRLHLRVGRICEARLPDDAGWLVEAAVFHLDQSGTADRAEGLKALRDRRAVSAGGVVGARVQRIAPGATPLGADAQNTFDAMSRALAGALRIGRLYPQGSQLAVGFQQQVKSALDQLLAQVSPITISVDGQILKANNVLVPVRPNSGREVLRDVLEDRLVASLTVSRGITPEELEAIVGALSETTPQSAMTVDYWDRFLVARGIRNADLVQKAYVAHRSDGGGLQAVEKPFDTAGIRLLHEALRYFKAACDSLKLYPPGHALVEESIVSAQKPFEALLTQYPSVTLAVAEGRLLANGKPFEARAMVETGEFVMDQIAKRRLISLTLAAGLTQEEIRLLTAFFALPHDDPEARAKGERMLVEADVRHFRFGARVYARRESVKEGEQATTDAEAVLLPTKPLAGPRPPKRVSVSPRARADVRARVYLTKPATDLLTEAFEKSFAALLEALNYGSMCDLAVQLVQHLCGAARDASGENRAHALRVLSRGLQGTSLDTQRMVVSSSAPPLRDLARSETQIPVVRALLDALAPWVVSASTSGAFAPLLDVLRDGVAARRINPATPPQVAALLNELGRTIPQKKFLPALMERVRKGNRDDREAAAQLLASLGDAGTAPLLEAFVAERSPQARQALAGALKLIGPAGAVGLAKLVQPDADREIAVAVLDVIHQVGATEVDGVFIRAMQHPESRVQAAAVELSKRLPAAAAAGMLRRALKELPEERRPAALRLAAELKSADLAADVCRLLESEPPEPIAVACCTYLAAVPSKMAVPLLTKIVDTKPKLFGMIKGQSDEVRAAAVWALGQVESDEARKVVERARKEGNTKIRVAATQAMKAKGEQAPPKMDAPPPKS